MTPVLPCLECDPVLARYYVNGGSATRAGCAETLMAQLCLVKRTLAAYTDDVALACVTDSPTVLARVSLDLDGLLGRLNDLRELIPQYGEQQRNGIRL